MVLKSIVDVLPIRCATLFSFVSNCAKFVLRKVFLHLVVSCKRESLVCSSMGVIDGLQKKSLKKSVFATFKAIWLQKPIRIQAAALLRFTSRVFAVRFILCQVLSYIEIAFRKLCVHASTVWHQRLVKNVEQQETVLVHLEQLSELHILWSKELEQHESRLERLKGVPYRTIEAEVAQWCSHNQFRAGLAKGQLKTALQDVREACSALQHTTTRKPVAKTFKAVPKELHVGKAVSVLRQTGLGRFVSGASLGKDSMWLGWGGGRILMWDK
jgi:hypothetical protein